MKKTEFNKEIGIIKKSQILELKNTLCEIIQQGALTSDSNKEKRTQRYINLTIKHQTKPSNKTIYALWGSQKRGRRERDRKLI